MSSPCTLNTPYTLFLYAISLGQVQDHPSFMEFILKFIADLLLGSGWVQVDGAYSGLFFWV